MHVGGRFAEFFSFAQDGFAIRSGERSAEELFKPAQLLIQVLNQQLVMADEHILPFLFELLLNEREEIDLAKHRLRAALGIAAREMAGDALQNVDRVAKEKNKLRPRKQRPEKVDFFAVVSDLFEPPTDSVRDAPSQKIENQVAKGGNHIRFGKGIDPFTRPSFAATENYWLLIENGFNEALRIVHAVLGERAGERMKGPTERAEKTIVLAPDHDIGAAIEQPHEQSTAGTAHRQDDDRIVPLGHDRSLGVHS